MWGITIFGLVIVLIIVAIAWSVTAARRAGHAGPSEMRDETERELGVRETTLGEEESPLNRPRTGA